MPNAGTMYSTGGTFIPIMSGISAKERILMPELTEPSNSSTAPCSFREPKDPPVWRRDNNRIHPSVDNLMSAGALPNTFRSRFPMGLPCVNDHRDPRKSGSSREVPRAVATARGARLQFVGFHTRDSMRALEFVLRFQLVLRD